MSMDEHQLLGIIEAAIQDSMDGNLTDSHRVKLYRLALTVAANEFHRIERQASGTINPGALVLMQEIALICSDEPLDPSAVLGRMKDAMDKEDSRGSEPDAG